MLKFTCCTNEGRITSTGVCHKETLSFQGRPDEIVLPTGANVLEDYVVFLEGEFVIDKRPVLELGDRYALSLNTDWDVLGIPEGSTVIIDGEEAGTTDASGLTLSFEFPGIYVLEIRPPFPWRDAKCEVTVS